MFFKKIRKFLERCPDRILLTYNFLIIPTRTMGKSQCLKNDDVSKYFFAMLIQTVML